MEAAYQWMSKQGQIVSLTILVTLLVWESAHPFFEFFRQATGTRIKHGLRNASWAVLNGFVVAVCFVGYWLWITQWCETHQFGLHYWANLPKAGAAVASILLLDFWTYWWHRMNHEVPFFWRFHQVHHSDTQMDVTTGVRFHLGEIILSSILRGGILAFAGAELWHVALYELCMFPVVQFHHANIHLPDKVDRILRVLLVTPAMHKVHHSRLRVEADSNYTSMLSIWDRLFGTFRLRDDPDQIEFGVRGLEAPSHQTLRGMASEPLSKKESTNET